MVNGSDVEFNLGELLYEKYFVLDFGGRDGCWSDAHENLDLWITATCMSEAGTTWCRRVQHGDLRVNSYLTDYTYDVLLSKAITATRALRVDVDATCEMFTSLSVVVMDTLFADLKRHA